MTAMAGPPFSQSLDQNHLRFIQRAVGLEQHPWTHRRQQWSLLAVLSIRLPSFIVRAYARGGIQQNVLQRPPGDDASNTGTGGLGLGSDDSHLLPNQLIRQAGLAHKFGRPMTATNTEDVS